MADRTRIVPAWTFLAGLQINERLFSYYTGGVRHQVAPSRVLLTPYPSVMSGGNSTSFDTQDSSKTKCVFFFKNAHVCVDKARLSFCIVRTEQRDYVPPSFIFYMWAIGTESMWAVNSFEAPLLRAIQRSHLRLYKDHTCGGSLVIID